MSDDFFSDSGKEKTEDPRGRDPREYPSSDDTVPDNSFGARRRNTQGHRFGVLVIVAGVIFFLHNIGLLHIGSIFQYWPLLVIGAGVSQLRCSRGRAKMSSIVVIAVGAFFLLHNLHVLSPNFGLVWPAGLIALGILLLAGRMDAGRIFKTMPRMTHHENFDDREVHLFSFFGGVKRVMDSEDFRGGEALAIFGGVDLDLRLAQMSGAVKEVVIDANALFGGVNIKVPDDWRVAVRGIGMFGGYVDKTLRRKSVVKPNGPLLIVTGYAAFGGIEVQS